jgi:hypothetical protein
MSPNLECGGGVDSPTPIASQNLVESVELMPLMGQGSDHLVPESFARCAIAVPRDLDEGKGGVG